VADCFENKAPSEIREKWKLRKEIENFNAPLMVGDGSRGGPPLRKLNADEQSKL
jgi:sarcosine oxidase/L-pipecolate oxidase